MSTSIRLTLLLPLFAATLLSACGTVQSAAQQDCTSVGLRIGTPDYESCFKARVREREMDYSNTFLPSSQ
jgi:predicted small secreted protein